MSYVVTSFLKAITQQIYAFSTTVPVVRQTETVCLCAITI